MSLREAWANRLFRVHFISKLSDCDGENGETNTSIDFARESGFISTEAHRELVAICAEVGRMLGSMLRNPEPFLVIHP